MLNHGVLNPYVLSLLARFRHTNALVIADRGFPSWPAVETIDLSLVDDIPTVAQVLTALRPLLRLECAYMAEEFRRHHSTETVLGVAEILGPSAPLRWEPHVQFKTRVPGAIGLIRTADTRPYANMILISG